MIEYDVILVLDSGECLPPVKECLASINDHLSTMGVQERVKMQSRMPLWILRVARELSEREIDDMRTVIKADVLTSEFSFRSSVLAVELIRRKPGNVSLVSP